MSKNTSPVWIVTLFIILLSPALVAWGIYGHEHINKSAVFALPETLQRFFYNHIDFVTQESTVPDLRKHTLNDKSEFPRHYINLEEYGPIDSIPQTFPELKKKYNDAFLQENGILPWYVEEMMDKLTLAMKEKHKTQILFIASDLGHYLADASMPLHASTNHDGEKTNQKGIHSFWEAQLPDMYGNDYNYRVDDAVYITNIHEETWRIIKESNRLVDSLLLPDQKLRTAFGANSIYKLDATGKIVRNKFNSPVHTEEYARQYHTMLNGMIERQMRKSISATANFWYTAWVNAGKPDLSDLDPADLTTQNASRLRQEYDLWKKGKLTGINSESEF